MPDRDCDHGLEVQRIRRPVVEDAPLRMREAPNRGVLHRLDHLGRQPRARVALARVEAELHPVELCEHVVGQVEPSVPKDVDLDAAKHAERGEAVVGLLDLLALSAQRVGVEARDDTDVRRVVADREVLVAEVAGGGSHVEHRVAAVRPRRMAVEIAAHVVPLDESRRLAGEGCFAELGRAPGDAELGVHAGLVRRLGQRLERVDVRRSAGPPHQLRAEAAGLRKGERHRHALDGHAERGAVGPFDDRHDLREPVERVEDLGGSRGRDDDREVEREIRPAARVTGHLATERLGDLADEVSSGVQQQATPRPVRLRVQALEDPALGRGSNARHALQRALAGDPAEVLRGLGAEGGCDVQHPLRRDPEQAAEPDELRSNPASELVKLGDRAGLRELPQSRGDPRADSPQLAHATLADEHHDRRSRLADRRCCSPVRA